uniref:Uncharacterized protein n=1 Tax=Picea glauca TaxID=3330 RepID=A0A124GMG7_PICGL|nr:hypothetical protein ABT39_MTgene2472 [Picea glauca]QHR88548.1 hypothetical protein Q903MT_gene2562 [Picea sitchensis]
MREIKLRRTHRRVRRLDGLGLRDIQGETAPSSGYPSRECLKALVFTGNSSHGKALPFGKERNYFIYNSRLISLGLAFLSLWSSDYVPQRAKGSPFPVARRLYPYL